MISITRPDCPHSEALSNNNYKHRINKQALSDASSGKCMYCESHIRHIGYGDIEHIKPKAQGKYPELAYVWSNLGYSCSICNNLKSDKYDADFPYLNPYEDNPEEHLLWRGSIVLAKRGCERATITIMDIGLNRPHLIEARNAKIREVDSAVSACFRLQNLTLRDKALDELREFSNANSEYSACLTSILEAHNI